MNELNEALSLLLAGMATVFTMLLLVVLSARLLIRLVNHFAEAPPPPTGIQEEELAVLAAAVEAVTQGQGQISSIRVVRRDHQTAASGKFYTALR